MMALYPQEKNLLAQTQPKHIRNALAAATKKNKPLRYGIMRKALNCVSCIDCGSSTMRSFLRCAASIRIRQAATCSAIVPLADLEYLAHATANSSSSQSSSVNK